MRRFASQSAAAANVRAIAGAAPVIYFPTWAAPKVSKDKQVEKNTAIALELIKRFKGPLPAAYTRKTAMSIDQIEKEIESLLGGAEKLRKKTTDDQPMDKLSLMERCLRHGLWSYYKDEGKLDFAQLQKWLVYTATDETRFALLKRETEAKAKLADFRKRRAEAGQPDAPLPKFNWAQEYAAVADREIVVEKRLRYDTLAANTTERNEAAVNALQAAYRAPAQAKRLDDLVALLEQFKPVLAREAIMQRLTIKHLEGQLAIWRYLDWCPEVRDRVELECDNYHIQYWMPGEERRMLKVRLRSKNEVKEVMEKAQAAKALASGTSASAVQTGTGNETRDKLLKELLQLQARLNKREDEGAAAPKAEKKGHH